jgi:hypothetical protein
MCSHNYLKIYVCQRLCNRSRGTVYVQPRGGGGSTSKWVILFSDFNLKTEFVSQCALIKKKKIFLIYKDIQNGAVAKSYDKRPPHIWLNI